MGPEYIYQLDDWPSFRYDLFRLAPALSDANVRAGTLAGMLTSLGLDERREVEIDAAVTEVVSSSAIEGEKLNLDQVRSSVSRQLGFEVAGLPRAERDVEGVVMMALDATQGYDHPLTAERLFGWHNVLFPSGMSGFFKIRVADWRDDEKGPMQVVSGAIGHEWVHYEAPTGAQVPGEMRRFLEWFERDDGTEARLKAGLAHLWFVTVHPFDDGNGRIGRAIMEMGLARAERSARRGYSLSESILRNKDPYYDALERSQKGTMDVTEFLAWYLDTTRRALDNGRAKLERSLWRSKFWHEHRETPMNERQRRVLHRFLGDFDGKLTNNKWAALAKSSHDAALRDLTDLVQWGILVREGAGRGVRYVLADPPPERLTP